MPIFAVRKIFNVQVTQIVPADSKDLAESKVSKEVKDTLTYSLLAKNYIVDVDNTESEVVDLADVFR